MENAGFSPRISHIDHIVLLFKCTNQPLLNKKQDAPKHEFEQDFVRSDCGCLYRRLVCSCWNQDGVCARDFSHSAAFLHLVFGCDGRIYGRASDWLSHNYPVAGEIDSHFGVGIIVFANHSRNHYEGFSLTGPQQRSAVHGTL
jgi:hypothetical protein